MGVESIRDQDVRLHLEGLEDKQCFSHVTCSIFGNLTRGLWREVKLELLGDMP